jgi:glycoprotein endo-alpha-1,2-mannosidase
MRTVLGLVVAVVCLAVKALGQQPAAPRAELNLAQPRTPNDDRPVIGAYYYPWYGVNNRPLSHDWDRLMRRKLNPPQKPAAGLYRSDDSDVIAKHVAQSRRAGLDFWAVSWWGPGSATDRTIREAIFKHSDADELRYAVLYETTGRLGGFDRPRHDQLVQDLTYLEKHFFKHPYYLRISGRPVLFIYLTRVYFRETGLDKLAEVRKQFPDVYIVGDDVFGADYKGEWAKRFDAVTSYDVYGQSMQQYKATSRAVDALASNYTNAKKIANSVGRAFVPAVSPGYNDTAERPGHPGAARYFVNQPESKEGDLFRAMIRRAALPHLDERCGRLLMVTSFNEWYEDSQIEATASDTGTTAIDNSDTKSHFTGGDRYTDYGPLYLDILREEALGKPQLAE